MSVSMTPKQKNVLDFIISFISEKRYSPTQEEIARKLKLSIPTVNTYIKILVDKGYLSQGPGARNLAVTQAPSVLKDVRRFDIGIIGYGIVGQAVHYGFSRANVRIYDKYKDTEGLESVVANSEYIFIGLPTPTMADESGIDLSIVDEMVKKIAKLASGTDKIVIIKSTVTPGTTAKYIKKYPRLLFCFNPEFLRESSFLSDFVNTDRIVIGAESDDVFRRVSSLYQSITPLVPIYYTDPTTAEMVKYMANCFLATKVIFANEMYDICEKIGVKYEEVKKMVVADKRIKDGHLDITTLRGFGGKCFPKDLLSLRAMAKAKGVDTAILDAVWKKNIKIRKVRDWEEIPFAVSKPGFGRKS
jgi:UDPglucose 6-dehydrogenase